MVSHYLLNIQYSVFNDNIIHHDSKHLSIITSLIIFGQLAILEIVWEVIPSEVPSTSVGQESILAVRPFRKIWWRKSTVSELRKMELMSSCEQGGAFEEAAILKGRRKQEMRISSCSTYSSSASTIRNTRLTVRQRLLVSNQQILSRKSNYTGRQARLDNHFHHSPVPFSHALSVGGFYVIFHNLFPSSPGIMLLVSYYLALHLTCTTSLGRNFELSLF